MQLSPFKLERYLARYEFNVEYLLCSSDCESLAIQDLLALEPQAPDLFQKHWLGYTEPLGAPALRQEICRLYTTIQPEQVLGRSSREKRQGRMDQCTNGQWRGSEITEECANKSSLKSAT